MRKREWTEEMVADLSKMGDKDFEKKHTISRPAIIRERKIRNIKPFNNQHGTIQHKIIDGIEHKWCSGGHWESIQNFIKLKSSYDGLKWYCKLHEKENRKKMKNWQTEYYKQWAIDNPNKVKAKYDRYMQTTKGKINNLKKARRRIERDTVIWSDADIENMYKVFGYQCAWCDVTENLELEHFIPVVLGGKTQPGNVYPACFNCNRGRGGKHAKHPEQYCIDRFGNNQKYLEIKAKLDKLN